MFHHHSHHFLKHTENSTSSNFWGAFWGAFFAFLFGLITYVVTKRRERFIQHKNALVKLERVLNTHLEYLAILEIITKDSIRIITSGKVTSSMMFKLNLPENFDMEIGSIDLVNKFFAYRSTIERFNLNVNMINHALTRIEDLFINGQIPNSENFAFVKNTLESFDKDFPAFNKRTKKFLILTRIHITKTKYRNSFIYGVFNTQWEQEISLEEIEEEHKKLDKEIEQIIKESREDIL